MPDLRDTVIRHLEDQYEVHSLPRKYLRAHWFSRVDLNSDDGIIVVWLNQDRAAVGRPNKTTATILYADPDFFTKLHIAIGQVPLLAKPYISGSQEGLAVETRS